MSELTVLVELGDRQLEMRKPSDGSIAILARVYRTLPKIENAEEMTPEARDRVVRNLGTLGLIVDGMIVKDADKEWLEEAMIAGDLSPEEVYAAIGTAAAKFGGQSAPAKKAAPVRRRR